LSAKLRTTPISRIVRFARPNILFYDGHAIDLHQLTRALYLVRMKGEETKEEARSNLSSVLGRSSGRIKPAFQLKGPF
jgi:prepilin-type processing-associated H-X9-DG protein